MLPIIWSESVGYCEDEPDLLYYQEAEAVTSCNLETFGNCAYFNDMLSIVS